MSRKAHYEKMKGTMPKVGKVMHEFKEGSLKSSSGDKVISKDQAIAIALSEERERRKKKGK